jgi:hypothetical protein
MAKLFLKNVYENTIPEQEYYFYDGRTTVRFGVIELPAENTTWIKRAFGDGFRIDPDSGETLDYYQVITRAESAVSAGEDVEGTDLGGQPAGEDGLRESELPRDASVPEARVASRGRPRTAKRTP